MLRKPGSYDPNRSSSRAQSSTRRKTAEGPDDLVRKLTRLPGNKKCADCSAKLPQVANLTFGTFVCLSCGGVHREFNHRIKGVGHSAFTQEEASFLKANGNDNVNAMYLANFSNGNERLTAPDGSAGTVDGQLLRVWLRRKYVDRAWAANNRNAASNIQPTRAQIPPKKQAAAPPPAPSNDLLGGGDLFGAAPQPPAPAAAAPVPSYGNDAEWDAFGKSRANANSFQADFGSQPQSNNNAQPSLQADFSSMSSQPPPQTPAPIPSFQPNFPSPDPPQQQHQQASFNPNFPQPSTPTRSQPAPAFEASFQHQPLPGAAMSAPPVSNDPPMQNGFNADFGNFPTSPTNHAQQNVQQPQMFQPQQQMQMQQPPQQEQNMQQQGFNPTFEQPQQQMQMQQKQQGFNPAFEQPQQQMQQPPQQQQQGFNHNFQQQQTQMQQPQQQNMQQQGYNPNFQQQPPQQQMQQPPQQQQNMQQQGYNPNFQQQQQMQMHQQGFNPNFHQQMQMQQPTPQPQQNMQQQGFNPSFQQQQQMQMQQPPTQQMELPAPEQRANNTPPTIQTQPGPVADGMSMSIPSPIGANTSTHMPTTESGSNLNDDALPNTSENQAPPVPEPVQVKEESADPFDAFNSLSIGDAPPMMNSLHSHASMNGMGAPSTQEVKQEESIVQPPVQHITHEVGKKLLYRDSKNIESVVEILKVHRDDELVPYYEIKLPCGKEKQTDNAHLSEPPSNEELLKNIHEAIGGFDTAKLFALNQFIKSL